jgi:hypothetical protein
MVSNVLDFIYYRRQVDIHGKMMLLLLPGQLFEND